MGNGTPRAPFEVDAPAGGVDLRTFSPGAVKPGALRVSVGDPTCHKGLAEMIASPGRVEDTASTLPTVARGDEWARAFFRVLLLTLGVLDLAFQAGVLLPRLLERTDMHRDVTYSYQAVERIHTGQPLYWPWPDYGPHIGSLGADGKIAYHYPTSRYPYPPLLPAALAVLPAPLPYVPFARVWTLLVFAGLWTYAACLAKLAVGRVTAFGVLMAGLLVTLAPHTYWALTLANPDPVLWGLIGLALVSPRLRGFGFAFAGAVKLYTAWPLLLAMKLEGRRVWLPALATGAVLVALGAVAMGPARYLGAWWDWRHMLPVIGQGMLTPGNYSISMGGLRLARILGWWTLEVGPASLPVRLYLSACAVGVPLLTLWLTRRWSPRLRYATLIVAAMFFSPLAWSMYIPLAFAPVAIWWGERSHRVVHRPASDASG